MKLDSTSNGWETIGSGIYVAGMSGTCHAPAESNVSEAIKKLDQIEKYWSICESLLTEVASGYQLTCESLDTKSLFFVTAISFYDEYWGICFGSEILSVKRYGCWLLFNTE